MDALILAGRENRRSLLERISFKGRARDLLCDIDLIKKSLR